MIVVGTELIESIAERRLVWTRPREGIGAGETMARRLGLENQFRRVVDTVLRCVQREAA